MLVRSRLVVLVSTVLLGLTAFVAGGHFHAAGATAPSYLFRDEFNGTTLDVSHWQPNWLGASNASITKPINGAELSCYDPAQVREPGDGYLHLSAAHRTCRTDSGTTYAYASGLVETNGRFSFTNGVLEARVWLPGTSAIQDWPAVWTDGTGSWPATGESDIMEGLSGKACFHYHSPAGGPGGCAAGNFTGWHTYGEEVRNGTATYYYDGVKIGSETTVVAPHYIILNLGVGGYGGAVAAPVEMLVDYIRVSPLDAAAPTTTTAAPATTTTTTAAPAPAPTPTTGPPAPSTPTATGGYITVSSTGRVRAFGNARSHGELQGRQPAAPVVAAAPTATGRGYWLAGRDGSVHAFGDARSYGSMADRALRAPIVGMTATRSGHGYYLLGADGGVFTFGDARFHGSTGDLHLAAPVIDIALSRTGRGYWLVASDGGVFTFGDAHFHGSTGNLHLTSPIASIASGRTGYWLVARDGGIFAFNLPFRGSLPSRGITGTTDANRIRAFRDGSGYYVLTAHGALFTFGKAPYYGTATPNARSGPAVDMFVTP